MRTRSSRTVQRHRQKDEQRRHARYALSLEVRMTPLDEAVESSQAAHRWRGVTVDVSNGGLAIQTREAAPVLHLPVKLWLPLDGLPVRVPVLAVVRRVSDAAGDSRYVGVQFAW
jgi:hypothetical protein